jgi:hypothetical protein
LNGQRYETDRQPEECKSYYAELEGRGIRFLQAEIESIEPESHQVETSAGSLIADILVVALDVELSGPSFEFCPDKDDFERTRIERWFGI